LASFPLGAENGKLKVDELLAEYPDAVAGLFIEKPGPNDRGVFHTSSGKATASDGVAHLHLLAEALTASDRVTIGIGDGGNEVGFGTIGRALEASLPLARSCGCGCGGGIPGNSTRLGRFRQVMKAWRRVLLRRSQRPKLSWERFNAILKLFPIPIGHVHDWRHQMV
jgi:hypothetical protein